MARRARTRRMAGGKRRHRRRASRKSRKLRKSRKSRRSRRRRGGNMVMKAAVPFTLAYLNNTYGKKRSRKYRR